MLTIYADPTLQSSTRPVWEKVANEFPDKNIAYFFRRYRGRKNWIYKLIQEQHQYDLVIIDASHEPLTITKVDSFKDHAMAIEYQWYQHLYSQIKVPVLFFVGDGNMSSINNANDLCYGYFDTYYNFKGKIPEPQLEKKPFKLACLNRLARPNRIQLFNELKKRPYFNEIYYSFLGHGIKKNDTGDIVLDTGKHVADFGHYKLKYLEPLVKYVDHSVANKIHEEFIENYDSVPIELEQDNGINNTVIYSSDWDDFMYANHPYINAEAHIVTETYPFYLFVSEKSFKPLCYGIPFIINGYAGTVAYLRRYGFDTYDDIIPHVTYDVISDYNDRFNKMLEVVDNFMETDFKRDINRERSNIEHFFSDETYNKFYSPLISQIENALK